MEKLTGKGSRGTRKTVADVEAGGKAGIDATDQPGNGEIGDKGPAPSAQYGGTRQSAGWHELTDAVHDERRQVVRMWFPEQRDALYALGNGTNAEVLIGEPAYQVTSGEIVAL